MKYYRKYGEGPQPIDIWPVAFFDRRQQNGLRHRGNVLGGRNLKSKHPAAVIKGRNATTPGARFLEALRARWALDELMRARLPRHNGIDADGFAQAEADHFVKCPGCNQWLDMRTSARSRSTSMVPMTRSPRNADHFRSGAHNID